jgi:hypothetical protein
LRWWLLWQQSWLFSIGTSLGHFREINEVISRKWPSDVPIGLFSIVEEFMMVAGSLCVLFGTDHLASTLF